MTGDTLIPVENAAVMLSGASDIRVSAKDVGSHLIIESMNFTSVNWKKKSSVRILVEDGRRYVSKKAILKALDKIGVFDEE